jgi:SAM-dependent methyltransferase
MTALQEATTTSGSAAAEATAGALADRLFTAGVGAVELLTTTVGVSLGLYRALHDHGPVTYPELAATAGIAERYAREWLEQQATADFITVDDPTAPAAERRYSLPPGAEQVLLEEENLAFLAPMGDFVVSFCDVFPELLTAYRTGAGVPYEHYGKTFRDAQAAFNRPAYVNLLVGDWLANGAPDVHARLSEPNAAVADIGCGLGWSTIAIARGYPNASVIGLDADTASIADARANAASVGLADRARFDVHDAASGSDESTYDVAFVMEALHDMSRPVEALSAIRAMLKPDGVLIVMDERVADAFAGPGDVVERFMFGASVLHCLPVGLAEQPSAGTGTVMRTETVRQYAAEAGYSAVDVLPIEHDFFRFYRLTP